MKNINLEEILENYYQEAYKNTKPDELYPVHWGTCSYIKQAIKEVCDKTVELCIEKAELDYTKDEVKNLIN